MQYQVYRDDTRELIAWIDTEKLSAIALKGYSVLGGENLKVVEEETGDEKKTESRKETFFDKVTYQTFRNAVHDGSVNVGWDICHLTEYYKDLKLPQRSTEGSAGYDFFAPARIVISAHSTVKFPTGIKASMRKDLVLMLYPRSSLGTKFKLTLDNTIGVIDSDYYNNPNNEGQMFAQFTNHSDKECVIEKGVAYCQGVFHQYFKTDDDAATEKQTRNGGFGSTDR